MRFILQKLVWAALALLVSGAAAAQDGGGLCAEPQSFDPVAGLTACREQQNRCCIAIRAQSLEQAEPIFAGHHDVENRQVETKLLEQFARRRGV